MVSFTEEDHRRVSAAVAAAESGTDAEIVTVVAPFSDKYHDAALHWAILMAVSALFAATVWPVLALWPIDLLSGGWSEVGHGTVILLALGLWLLIFLLALGLLRWRPLRLALTPRSTQRRRVRARALTAFRIGAERRTVGRTGVLLYLSDAERMAELIADETIHSRTDPDDWAYAMAELVDAARCGRVADGMVAAVEAIGPLVTAASPKTMGNPNELFDRLIEL